MRVKLCLWCGAAVPRRWTGRPRKTCSTRCAVARHNFERRAKGAKQMTNAEYPRQLREKARAEGRCYVCRAREAKPGRSSCQHCIDRTAVKKRTLVKAGRCPCGRPPAEGRAKCERCLANMRASARRRTARAAERGLCTHCRKWPARPGGTYCLPCRRVHNAQQNERYVERRAKGLCGLCFVKRASPGRVTCKRCRDKYNAYHRRWDARRRAEGR